MMYTSSSIRPSCTPPNITARCWFTAVNVKWEHGGGLGPVVGGEDHLPAEGEAVQSVYQYSHSWMAAYSILSVTQSVLANTV